MPEGDINDTDDDGGDPQEVPGDDDEAMPRCPTLAAVFREPTDTIDNG